MPKMKLRPTTDEHQLELARKHRQRINRRLDSDGLKTLCVTTELIAGVRAHRQTYEAQVINSLQYLTPKDLARLGLLAGILSLWKAYPKIHCEGNIRADHRADHA